MHGVGTERSGPSTASAGGLLSKLRFMLGQPLLQLRWRLKFRLLRRSSTSAPRGWVARGRSTFGFGLLELAENALIVGGYDVLGDAFHTEDLDVWTGSVGQCIFDGGQGFLVDLIHVDH